MKVQIIKYKCCGKIFAACREPECYTDVQWQRDLRKYSNRGDIVETVSSTDFQFGKCECKNTPNLFNNLTVTSKD